MNNKFEKTLPSAAVQEDFLKSFGFNFDDEVYKFELILEAGELAKVRVTFNQAPNMADGVHNAPTILKNYKLVEI